MIELFPTSVLDTSILTAVLVGLLLVWFFQEWLGWGFTGLVVPGYLASVIVIQPLTGAVMIAEGVATWALLVALSDAIPRWWPWSPLFGRDRFFLTLLSSVAVRLAMEGVAFPWMAENLHLRVAAELHSMGLVVVPLLAYAIWRNGPVRAVPRLGLPLLLTWALLEWLLLRWTNLSLGSFELTYEDLALDFVSSPRAYILLLFGAWLGSIANLRWGWDFGGIIVPGLLALCWLQPERLVATIGEALVIALVLRLALRLPSLREMNLAGGRLLVLAMLLAYLLKFALGHLLGAGWPGLRLRQLFGFGYLLPALIALRMVLSGDPFRTIVPATLTSLGGFLTGSSLAWLLAVLWPVSPPPSPEEAPALAADSALVAAWRAGSTAPRDLRAELRSGRRGVVPLGEGALWLGEGGRPLALRAHLEPAPLAALGLGLTEALGARALLLCGTDAVRCQADEAALGGELATLGIELGETNRLELARVDMERVPVEQLQQRIGELEVTRGRDSRLILRPESAWALAAALRGRSPAAFEHPLRRPLDAPPAGIPTGLLRAELARPMGLWARGGESAEEALALAAATGTFLGLELTREGRNASLIGPDWRLLARSGGQPLILTVPWVEDEPNAAALALSLALLWDAAFVILDSPSSARADEPARHRPGQAALLGALEALGPEARVVTVRGLRDLHDVEADLVLSLGRPLLAGTLPPGWLRQRLDPLLAQGLTVAAYDGSPHRISLLDPANPARQAATSATGQEAQATLFASGATRARAATPAPDSPTGRLVAGLPRLSLDLEQLLPAVAAGEPGEAWDAWRQATRALGEGQVGAREALEKAARDQGAEARLLCEPLAGCRWTAAVRCGPTSCEAVLAGLNASGPAPGRVEPSGRLLLGDGVLRLQGLPREWLRP